MAYGKKKGKKYGIGIKAQKHSGKGGGKKDVADVINAGRRPDVDQHLSMDPMRQHGQLGHRKG